MKKFLNSVAVLDKLVWKCDMSNEEISDMMNIMNEWIKLNINASNYEWHTSAYSLGALQITHNKEYFWPCISFATAGELDAFILRFGCIK